MRRMYSLNQLQELADSRVQALVEGGTLNNAKPIFWHNVQLKREATDSLTGYVINFIILNNDATPITLSMLQDLIRTQGFVGEVHGSRLASNPNTDVLDLQIALVRYYDNVNFYVDYYDSTFKYYTNRIVGFSNATCTDLGVNKIN